MQKTNIADIQHRAQYEFSQELIKSEFNVEPTYTLGETKAKDFASRVCKNKLALSEEDKEWNTFYSKILEACLEIVDEWCPQVDPEYLEFFNA